MKPNCSLVNSSGQQLDGVGIQAGVTLPGHIVNNHRIDIAADQRLHGETKFAVGHDAILRHQTGGGFEVGGGHLHADDEVAGHEVLNRGEAIFADAHHHLLRQVDIAD